MPSDPTGALSIARKLDADLWPRLDARLAGFFADNQTEVTYVDLLEGDSVHYDLKDRRLTFRFRGDSAETVHGVDERSAAMTVAKWAKLRAATP